MPFFYPHYILERLIDGRDVEKMKTSEASQIVKEFWIRVFAGSLGQRNQKQLERAAVLALKKAGLGYFA